MNYDTPETDMTRIGVIGIGKWGINHLRTLQTIPCDFVGVADVDKAKGKIADQYHIKFFENYKQLLDEVDAVTVTVPTDKHYDVVQECLHAGKHVLVEKPIAESAKQAKKLMDLAESQGVALSVGYLFRFNNAIKKIKDILPTLGDIEYISCRYIHSTKPPRKDSGVIMNLGIHVFDILNFITGKIPETVVATKKNLLDPAFEDSASALLRYKDFFATVELSCMHPEKARDLWVMGEKETVYVDYFDQKIVRYPLRVTYDAVERKEHLVEPVVLNEPLKDELQYFVDLISKNVIDTKGNQGKENYYTTLMGERALQSATTGKECKVR
jgi:UDP-N-acetylglucosamine 3-dehydrogenase